ncbi:peptide chain release factor 1 [Longimicrobium sp.]|uniref:peptide chain release factor 1 n=1 Tax=Longimicrobium sp. TaxID=2029185 RepID=UPI002E2F34BF|nr:peptide chain release factor 1 [Longimicrobium sp.]HEX6042606.1 peptide chain release factor 1 [Longimicrobium sp.]
MLDRIAETQRRYDDLSVQLADPNIHADPKRLREISREHSRLSQIVEAAGRLSRAEAELAGAREMLDDAGGDPELTAMAKDEAERLTADVARLEDELKRLLIPRDPLDDRDAVVEVRAGTGGDEAALFAGDLFRMYQRFADRRGWKVEVVSVSEGTAGGYKEAVFVVRGENAYGDLRYESGVHRVQRVPATETQGRIHTSAATVAVLPEAEEVDVQINPNELKIDVYRSSGPGGQSVNTTDSAVRITHLPTGLVVTCQDEKSQHKNKDKAMGVLRSRLLDIRIAEQEAERARDRKAQVGTGDRSAKIRTYNFPQSRVTDHRIGFTTHALQQVIDGSLDELIENLKLASQAERAA